MLGAGPTPEEERAVKSKTGNIRPIEFWVDRSSPFSIGEKGRFAEKQTGLFFLSDRNEVDRSSQSIDPGFVRSIANVSTPDVRTLFFCPIEMRSIDRVDRSTLDLSDRDDAELGNSKAGVSLSGPI